MSLYLTRTFQVFREIRTPFKIDFTENIQEISLVYENGTLIKPTRIGGHGGEAPMRAYFDAPVLFHFHAYAPFYNQSAIFDPWTTVGRNSLTFLITFNNQTRITYEHLVEEGCAYTPHPYGGPYYFHVKPGIIL